MKSANLIQMGQDAKEAAGLMAQAKTAEKNRALLILADLLAESEVEILEANERDKQIAQTKQLSEAMIDRLSLHGRLSGIIEDVRHIAQLHDPIGEEFDKTTLANGLQICKRRVPIGVLGVIYESRPNVTLDVAALTLKTGNCAILRGGSETLQTNLILLDLIQQSLQSANLPANAIQMIPVADREEVKNLLRLHESIDLIIPRGGAELHRFCRENSTIPVITGGIGICHLFVDESADQKRAVTVINNAKTQRPTVCNALDTLLVHEKIASVFIPQVIEYLQKSQVTFRVDQVTWNLLSDSHQSLIGIRQASEQDWDTEWLSLILGIKVVKNSEEAIQHIHKHSTGHSDGILTENATNAEKFIQAIDSAAVYVNASTRFTDGSQFGLGAEIAISTQKIHARGPMGLKELTTYKWIIQGNYQSREN